VHVQEAARVLVGRACGAQAEQCPPMPGMPDYLAEILELTSDAVEQTYLLCLWHIYTGTADKQVRRCLRACGRELDRRRHTGEYRCLRRMVDILLRRGHRAYEVAQALGMNYERVRRRQLKLRGKVHNYRKISPDEGRLILTMYADGYSIREIARALNRHISTVYYYIKRTRDTQKEV